MHMPVMITRWSSRLLGLGLVALATAGCAAKNDTEASGPDSILFNGKIVTVDKNFSIAEAVAIKDGEFVAVGSNNSVKRLGDSRTVMVDLEGKTALPGLNDPHEHFAHTLGSVKDKLSGRFSTANSIGEVLAIVKEKIGQTPPGEAISLLLGPSPNELKEKRYPDRRDLDQISPRNPVLLEWGGAGYDGSANSLALQKAGVTRNTPQPYAKALNGEIMKDGSGEPTGVLIGRAAVALVHNVLVQQKVETLVENIKRASDWVIPYGITSTGDPNTYVAGLQDNLAWARAYQRLSSLGDLKVRVNLMFRLPVQVQATDELLKWMDNLLLDPGFGNDTLRFGAIKLVLNDSTPKFKIPREETKRAIKAVHKAGWQLYIHVAGGETFDLAVEGLEEAYKEHPRQDARHIITHARYPTDKTLDALKRYGIMVEPQTGVFYGMSDDYEKEHEEPNRPAYGPTPLKTYLDHGIAVMTGADQVPVGPLFTIFEAVNRLRKSGKAITPQERITVEQAIRACTITPAYSTFQENTKGSIEPGKLADLVVLGRDILTVPPLEIKDIPVMRTMIGGKFVYTNPNQDPRQPVEYWFPIQGRREVINIPKL